MHNTGASYGTQAMKPIPETATAWRYFLESFVGSTGLVVMWEAIARNLRSCF